jgi:hypothetical protein
MDAASIQSQQQQRHQQFPHAPGSTTPTAAPTALGASAATLSPTKRRNSQVNGDVRASSSSEMEVAESSEAATKRIRPTDAPPKVLPRRYELCDVEDMVVLIAHMLAELIETNDALALRSGSLTRFHSR